MIVYFHFKLSVFLDQLQPNSASGSGALEHDPSSIYLRVPVGEAVPGPLPLGVSVIDASVALFGVVFPHVSFKHRSVSRDYLHSFLLSNVRKKTNSWETLKKEGDF